MRLSYVALNTLLFVTGTGIYSWGVPLVLAGNAVSLVVVAHRTHRRLWAIDMAAKAAGSPGS